MDFTDKVLENVLITSSRPPDAEVFGSCWLPSSRAKIGPGTDKVMQEPVETRKPLHPFWARYKFVAVRIVPFFVVW